MRINTDNNTLEISKSKVITGTISIEFNDGVFFPEKVWNDSIIVVLDSWLVNVDHILQDNSQVSRFNFFDGPFSFTIGKDASAWKIELYQELRLTNFYVIDINEFSYQLIKTSKEILKKVEEKSWESDEIKQFSSSLEAVISLLNI